MAIRLALNRGEKMPVINNVGLDLVTPAKAYARLPRSRNIRPILLP